MARNKDTPRPGESQGDAPKRPREEPVRPAQPAVWGDGVVDRRSGLDRRLTSPDSGTGLERRRGPGRRRTDFTRAAEEGEMTPEQFLFLMAIDAFKKANEKTFPAWTDVLEVIRLLGYRKTCASELNLANAEDWTEKPDAPSKVRSKPGHPEEGAKAA